jgi:hypothetical protein
MDVSNVVESLLTSQRDTEDKIILPELSEVYLFCPKALDFDALLSWCENHPINHKLTIVMDAHKTSSLNLKIPTHLPKNVQIHTAGPTFGDICDHAFEEPFDMTCSPFGRDTS